MTNDRQTRGAGGFTITELVVAVTLVALVFAVAIPFFHAQARAVAVHGGRFDAQLNARFGLTTIERDLRAAGIGVVDAQPLLVEAAPLAVTFNADLVVRDSVDGSAVYYDPDTPASAAAGMTKLATVRLPATSAFYPDCTFVQTGAPSVRTRAETISYYATRDNASGRSDQYILFRRVNADTAEVVARGIVVPTGGSIFRYFKTDSIGRLVEVPRDSLPMRHFAPMHGATSDVGRSALTDSVRVVAVQLVGRFRDRRSGRDVVDTARTSVRLVNAGLLNRATCGEPPILGSGAFVVWAEESSPGVWVTRLSWARATDEAGGERDVERYSIYRRTTAETQFGEPYLSVAAGESIYSFIDTRVEAGTSYVYAISAQDCTPSNSPLRETSPITIPSAP